MQIKVNDNEFQLFVGEKRILEHSKERPMIYVGVGQEDVDMYRGNFKITDYVTDGENEIKVSCLDFSDVNAFSRGKQKTKRGGIWYTCQSGIWQSVWLESTPKIYLEKVKITPNYDESSVSFKYFGCDDVEVSIYDGDSLIAKTKDTTVSIPDFKSWSPESPFLYDVVFSACGEEIKSYFGMRKFSVGNDGKGVKRLLCRAGACKSRAV